MGILETSSLLIILNIVYPVWVSWHENACGVKCNKRWEACSQFPARMLDQNWQCLRSRSVYFTGTTGRTDQMENFKHKYLMSIDGNSFVSRLPKFMNSGSVNFRVGMFDEWFDAWIREDEHYIRVDLDFGNLEDKLRWAIENDDKARLIGLQAREFAKNRLRNEDMECYMFRLLLEYAAICE